MRDGSSHLGSPSERLSAASFTSLTSVGSPSTDGNGGALSSTSVHENLSIASEKSATTNETAKMLGDAHGSGPRGEKSSALPLPIPPLQRLDSNGR